MFDLEFQNYVAGSFEFLVSEFGFRCVESTPRFVRFESNYIEVGLWLDRGELYLTVGKTARQQISFTLGEILRFRGVPEANEISSVMVTTSDALSRFVERMAQALRTYGDEFLVGDDASFALLAEQRRRESSRNMLDHELPDARSRADEAWHRKDYRAVIAAFEPVQTHLSASEAAKLAYAEKQIRPAGD